MEMKANGKVEKKMIMLPKKLNYDLPEGWFRARLKDAFITTKKSDSDERQEVLRLVWEVISLTHHRIEYVAGKNYALSKADRLANDLESWLGAELESLLNEKGGLEVDTIKKLIGREADIEVVFIDNDREAAFRHIQSITPPNRPVDYRESDVPSPPDDPAPIGTLRIEKPSEELSL